MIDRVMTTDEKIPPCSESVFAWSSFVSSVDGEADESVDVAASASRFPGEQSTISWNKTRGVETRRRRRRTEKPGRSTPFRIPKDQTTDLVHGKGSVRMMSTEDRPIAPYHLYNLYTSTRTESSKTNGPVATGMLTADTRIVDPDRRLSL